MARVGPQRHRGKKIIIQTHSLLSNPLNAELIPNCHSLSLLGSQLILHVSRIRFNNHRRFCRLYLGSTTTSELCRYDPRFTLHPLAQRLTYQALSYFSISYFMHLNLIHPPTHARTHTNIRTTPTCARANMYNCTHIQNKGRDPIPTPTHLSQNRIFLNCSASLHWNKTCL